MVNKFKEELRVRIFNDKVELLESFMFYYCTSFYYAKGVKLPYSPAFIIVPKGFIAETKDIANYNILHKYLYSIQFEVDLERNICDRIFLQAMKVAGVGFKRYLMYFYVRLFGNKKYKKL